MSILNKKTLLAAGASFLIVIQALFTGCASLQEVNIDQVVYSPEIAEYEKRLSQLDAASILGESDNPSFVKSCSVLAGDMEKSEKNPSLSKAALARLYALHGRVFVLADGLTSKAKDYYEESVNTYKGDVHSLILGSRLGIVKIEDSADVVNEAKLVDLEQAINFYKSGEYSSAAAKFDEAFIALDDSFRDAYGSIRDRAWTLKSTENVKLDGQLLSSASITVGQMLVLTQDNSDLLKQLTGGKKTGQSALYKKAKKQGLLTSVTDTKSVLSEDSVLTKIGCARFFWNLSSIIKNSEYAKAKYSIQYRGAGKQSPVADVSVENVDFDAVLGCVESEFLNLEDGINFDGAKKLSAVEYLEALKKLRQD